MTQRAVLAVALLLAACRRQAPVAESAAEPDLHFESFTNWTAKTEVFGEYRPLIVGETSEFTVHVTRLDTFKPVADGSVEIKLVGPDRKTHTFQSGAPSRPGIFAAAIRPSAAGEHRLSIHVAGGGIEDTHQLGAIEVAATQADATHDHGPEAADKVAFLKEQQWTLDFATVIVEDRKLRTSIRVPGEILPRAGGESAVSAPFDGRLVGAPPPTIGAKVSQGQVLASILPPTSTPSDLSAIELASNEAKLALQLVRRDRERAERLVEAGAAPAKRLEEARTAEATAEARLNAADIRLAQYEASSAADQNPRGVKLFSLRAPISGVISRIAAAPGANVKAGEIIIEIVDPDSVYVSAVVPEAELPRVRALSGAELEAPGMEAPKPLTELVSIGRVVDPQSRTFPVIYLFDNRDRAVAVHQSVYVRLLTRASEAAPAVPDSAIVDDNGRPIVFVQESGEVFARRPVTLGIREGGLVQVLDGVFPGERVVTRGAHLVRLAAMSNQVPAHGHVH